MRGRKKKEVLLLRPLDFRGEVLRVERETDNGLHCSKYEGVKHMFFKFGPAWTFSDTIRFLGVEGTPLTAHPTLDGLKIPISDFLREVWPENTYEKLPNELRNPIESDYGIICGIKAIMPDETLDEDIKSIKADSILLEQDIMQMENFGKSTPKKTILSRDTLMSIIIGILCFIAGAYSNLKGWF